MLVHEGESQNELIFVSAREHMRGQEKIISIPTLHRKKISRRLQMDSSAVDFARS